MEGYTRLEAPEYESDDWDVFKERLEGLFEIYGYDGTDASDLPKKRAILLNVYSKKTYDLFRTLSAPKKPKKKTFAELCALLDGRCSKKPSIVIRRF